MLLKEEYKNFCQTESGTAIDEIRCMLEFIRASITTQQFIDKVKSC